TDDLSSKSELRGVRIKTYSAVVEEAQQRSSLPHDVAERCMDGRALGYCAYLVPHPREELREHRAGRCRALRAVGLAGLLVESLAMGIVQVANEADAHQCAVAVVGERFEELPSRMRPAAHLGKVAKLSSIKLVVDRRRVSVQVAPEVGEKLRDALAVVRAREAEQHVFLRDHDDVEVGSLALALRLHEHARRVDD